MLKVIKSAGFLHDQLILHQGSVFRKLSLCYTEVLFRQKTTRHGSVTEIRHVMLLAEFLHPACRAAIQNRILNLVGDQRRRITENKVSK